MKLLKAELDIWSLKKIKTQRNLTLKSNSLLRHLDISQYEKKLGIYDHPNQCLKSLVTSLPDLTSLDISGTNLAGTGSYEDQRVVKCDIPGLVSRVDNPLEFLGLYKTEHEASMRAHIPAKEISGEVNLHISTSVEILKM